MRIMIDSIAARGASVPRRTTVSRTRTAPTPPACADGRRRREHDGGQPADEQRRGGATQ